MEAEEKIVTKTSILEPFEELVVVESVSVVVNQGDKTTAMVSAPANYQPEIELKVQSGKLTIEFRRRLSDPAAVTVRITTPHLTVLKAIGAGNTRVEGPFRSESFHYVSAGSGDATLNLEVDRMNTDLAGSGDVRLEGKAAWHTLDIAGSGCVSAAKFLTQTTTVSIAGSGDAILSVSQFLRARIVGSGDVTYLGTPQVDKKVLGSGEVYPLRPGS